MAGGLVFQKKMSAICKKTRNRVTHYKNCVPKMTNEWSQVGVKQAVRLVLKSGRLRLGNTLDWLIGCG